MDKIKQDQKIYILIPEDEMCLTGTHSQGAMNLESQFPHVVTGYGVFDDGCLITVCIYNTVIAVTKIMALILLCVLAK